MPYFLRIYSIPHFVVIINTKHENILKLFVNCAHKNVTFDFARNLAFFIDRRG